MAGLIGTATGERFIGPVPYWVDELAAAVQQGIDAVIFVPADGDRVRRITMFADEVVPAVRALG